MESTRCKTQTPWGQADQSKQITRGIMQYWTPSHGGYHVSDCMLKEMPEYMRNDPYTPLGWFEEDCAWSKVVICFPTLFSIEDQEAARSTVKSCYPELYQRLLNEHYIY